MTEVIRQHTSFLDLPGELRNKIYQQVLISEPPSPNRGIKREVDVHPNLLQTCRQINDEASPILYGNNTFTAHNSLLSGLPHLNRKASPVTSARCISQIRHFHVCLRLDTDAQFTAEKARAAFSGIESLTIEVQQAQFGGSDHSHLRLFEGVRGVKHVNIYGSIMAFRDYARWLEQRMMTPEGVEVEEYHGDDADEHVQQAGVRLRLHSHEAWMNWAFLQQWQQQVLQH